MNLSLIDDGEVDLMTAVLSGDRTLELRIFWTGNIVCYSGKIIDFTSLSTGVAISIFLETVSILSLVMPSFTNQSK